MILGADIGGSHISCALLDAGTLQLLPYSFRRGLMNPHGTADQILQSWSSCIRKTWNSIGLERSRIGIAMPGPFDYDRGIALMKGTEKYEALYGIDVRTALASMLDIAPEDIRFQNDASCFLLGEMQAKGRSSYVKSIGITLGTGLGSAIFERGTVQDANRWNRPFDKGFAEEYISTRFFVRRYKALTGATVKGAQELAQMVPADPSAQQVFHEFARNLASFVRDFVRDEHPELLVIGGNISKAWELIYPALEPIEQEFSIPLKIEAAILGEEAALIGAACCWVI